MTILCFIGGLCVGVGFTLVMIAGLKAWED